MTEISISPNIKTQSFEEFAAAFPQVAAKKQRFTARQYSNVIAAYIPKVGVVVLSRFEPTAATPALYPYRVEIFAWNAKNHLDYRGYDTAEKAEAAALEFLSRREASKKENAAYRAKSRAPHSLKIGDILYASWGYDQTNVDYYKVTRTTKHTVDLITIGKKRSASGDRCSPDPAILGTKVYKGKRASASNSVTIDSSRHASKCEPDATHYETPWGYGH